MDAGNDWTGTGFLNLLFLQSVSFGCTAIFMIFTYEVS